MRCPKCNYENKADSLYCGMCYEILKREKESFFPKPEVKNKKGKKRKNWLYLLVFLMLMGSYWAISSYFTFKKYNNYQIASGFIDVSQEPLQKKVKEKEFIRHYHLKGKKYKIVVLPLCFYDISAKVVGVRKWRDWEEQDCPIHKEIFPVDIGLIWGKVAEGKHSRYIKFYHTPASRFLHCKCKFPSGMDNLSQRYIAQHFSNNHIFPANDTLKWVIKRIKKGDWVKIEGYLIQMSIYKDGKKFYVMRSSFSRKDTCGGACESIYVKRIRVNNRIYE